MKKAIIFDMDGTLWDSTKPIAESWTEAGKQTIDPSFSLTAEDVRPLMGKTMDDIVKALFPNDVNSDKIECFWGKALSDEIEYLKGHPGLPYPDEGKTLARLKEMGYELMIVSNAQKGYIELYLNAYPDLAKYFSAYLCWGDTLLPKRGTILKIMKDHAIEKAVYVGDTAFDEEETHAAGLPFIHAAYGFGEANSPEAVAKSFSSLPEIIKRLL